MAESEKEIVESPASEECAIAKRPTKEPELVRGFDLNPSKVEGTMDNGILKLKIPKKEPKPEEKMMKVQLK